MASGLVRKRGQPDAIAKTEGKTDSCRVDKRILGYGRLSYKAKIVQNRMKGID